MSIQSAIQALSPLHYWTLSETTGTHFADLGSTALDMQGSGDLVLGAIGPEVGSHAVRIYSTMQLASAGAGITSFGNFSYMIFFTGPANGFGSGNVNFAGLGDITNQGARGFQVAQNSAGSGQMQISTLTVGLLGQQNVAFPQTFWHVYTFVYNVSTNTRQQFLDGVGATSGTGMNGTAPIAADSFWVKSAQPIVVAHLAYWPRVLSQTEINTVSGQILPWPYGEPINVPVYSPTGGSVTISPTDPVTQQLLTNQQTFMPEIANLNTVVPQIHTQTTQIVTDTGSINTSVGSNLAVGVQEVLNGITTTITGVGGAISRTIGDLFSGRTWDLLTTFDLGSACAPQIIDVNLGGGTFFGIQMNATAWADWYVFKGNADDYSTQALGTLQIFRGGSEVLRLGLHTTTHTIYPLPGVPLMSAEFEMPWVPGDYQVVLTPAPETCWHLVGLQFP